MEKLRPKTRPIRRRVDGSRIRSASAHLDIHDKVTSRIGAANTSEEARHKGRESRTRTGRSANKTTSREDIMTLNGAYRSWVRLDAVRSTIRWFTYKFWTCISHHLSHFATVFIERRAKGSNATGCIISRFTNRHDVDYKGLSRSAGANQD